MPLMWANMIQAGLPVGNMATYVEVLSDFPWEERIGNSLVVREPVGVVGCHHAVELPAPPDRGQGRPGPRRGLHGRPQAERGRARWTPSSWPRSSTRSACPPACSTWSPASARSWVRPSPPTPTSTWSASPAPPGPASGSAELASQTVKRVALELGGKSANIILDDADLAEVVPKGVFACYLNSGQTCTAHTRMLVPQEKHDEAVAIAAAAAEGFPVGPADQDGVMLGPLSSAAQRDRVRDYIQKGIDEGATLATGGPEPPEGLDTGYFVRPTVFGNVDQRHDHRPGGDLRPGAVDHPLRRRRGRRSASPTTRQYGLAGGVWSADEERAQRVARRMRTGQVDVNGGSFNIKAPFGGYKQSGVGRELGRYGLEEFLEVKSLQLND